MKRLQDWYNKPFQFQIKLTIRKSTLLKWFHRCLTVGLIIFIFVAKVHAQGIINPSPQLVKPKVSTDRQDQLFKSPIYKDPFLTELNHQKIELAEARRNKALQAKKKAEQRQAQLVAQTSVKTNEFIVKTAIGCGNDPNMAFIYEHESGCSTYDPNSLGCIGLGQACPGSKLYAVCPTLAWACENNFFVSYAISRYGSTYNAKQFWLAHSWW